MEPEVDCFATDGIPEEKYKEAEEKFSNCCLCRMRHTYERKVG